MDKKPQNVENNRIQVLAIYRWDRSDFATTLPELYVD